MKITYYGSPYQTRNPNRTRTGQYTESRWSRFKVFMHKVILWAAAFAIVAVCVTAGAFFGSKSETIAEVRTVQVTQAAPVLERIADCESGTGAKGSATHYKNGQVILKANKNGTIDIGKYQVNLYYWGKKASELGYDLTKESDNKKMAEWIYLNKGTGDWAASANCWK